MDSEIAVQTLRWYVPLVAGKHSIGKDIGGVSSQFLTQAVENGYLFCLICPDWRTKTIEGDIPRLSGKMALMNLPSGTPGSRPTSTRGGTMVVMLTTLLIPGQVVMGSLYEQLYHLGLVDTRLGLIIPGAVSVFGIFLFRQAMMQIPDELLQAARIDGCSEFRIYWDVVMPVSQPMVGAFCLIAFMGVWNNFL